MPKVSVLMPLYNGKEYIDECIKSIQAQTFADWEFIIINDYGSDDGCADIIKKYAQKDLRLKLIQAEKRLGIAGSLNLGLELCEGEYIARVDVDDPSVPERLEKEVKFMDSNRDLSLCSCWMTTMTPKESHLEKTAVGYEDIFVSSMFGCQICHAGAMLRKADFLENDWRYNPDYLSEDHELWIRIMSAGGKIDVIPEPLVCHRWGFGGLTMQKGERLRIEVRSTNRKFVQSIGVDCTEFDDELFSGWNHRPEAYAKSNYTLFLKDNYRLIHKIHEANKKRNFADQTALDKMLLRRWDWARRCCNLKFKEYVYGAFDNIKNTPVISVVLPTFNSVKSLSNAIDSIIEQNYTDWELLVINDYGSDDGTVELVNMYSFNDSRIRLVQAKTRLGLSRSLNLGICEAKGKYIARIDADDASMANRFEKQLKVMESQPDVGVCGSWQRHYGGKSEWIHKAESREELLKAELIFWCNICHSTVMLRKSMFVENKLEYNPISKAEDFELWSRAIGVMRIVNIPEILGDYNESGGITGGKFKAIYNESGEIAARTIERYLGVHVPEDKIYLLNTWDNRQYKSNNRERMLSDLEGILREIYIQNRKEHFYDDKALLQTISKFWHWVRDDMDWVKYSYHLAGIDDAFKTSRWLILKRKYNNFLNNQPDTKSRIGRIKDIVTGGDSKHKLIQNISNDTKKAIDKSVEKWTWDRYSRMLTNFRDYIPYYSDQKIRVLFVLQVSAFWPAQEQLYLFLLNDDRYEVKLLCYDDNLDTSIKTETTREYLKENDYSFEDYLDFDIDDYNPHVVFLQTAYDSNRSKKYKSANLKASGYRVIYIPYGIEISDTRHAHHDHFEMSIVENAWKIYTFSEQMKSDYLRHIHYKTDVVALGLPRFDALYNRKQFELSNEIKKRALGRKIVLFKVHFPKMINENGEKLLVTPKISEYISFVKDIEQMKDVFFIFMPHPRFEEFNDDPVVRAQIRVLMENITDKENIYIDNEDDYRPSLVNADAIIIDRSAVMIEAGATGVPVLYMYNMDYYEPMTKAVKELVDSYYQGTTAQDMKNFIKQVVQGEDPKKDIRNIAFKKCIPFFDGRCAERIADDIAITISKEAYSVGEKSAEKLEAIENRLALLEKKLDKKYEVLEALHSDLYEKMDKRQEWWTWERFVRTRELFDKNTNNLHRQIDYSTRDILVALDNSLHFTDTSPSIILRSECRLAEDSIDHIYPRGTANDDTRYPRFIKKCEDIISQKEKLAFLDLGCSGGGMVLDAVLRGHTAIGLEGSNYSEIRQRAEWRLLRKHLFTCNIVRPFDLMYEDGSNVKFDIITAWDVMEHIQENDLTMLMDNVKKHLSDDGIFVASIALYDDIDEETGVNWHVTVKTKEWWQNYFAENGFTEKEGLFEKEDMARGGVNHPIAYKEQRLTDRPYYFAVMEIQKYI